MICLSSHDQNKQKNPIHPVFILAVWRNFGFSSFTNKCNLQQHINMSCFNNYLYALLYDYDNQFFTISWLCYVLVCRCSGYCSFPKYLWEPLQNGLPREWISKTMYYIASDLWEKQKHIAVKEMEIIIQHKVKFTIVPNNPSVKCCINRNHHTTHTVYSGLVICQGAN